MKVLAIFTLTLAVATSYPVVKTWTLSSLSEAIEKKQGDPAMMPYLKDALNTIMLALFTGTNQELVNAVLPSPSGGATWTIAELNAALADPETKREYRVALAQAQNFVQYQNKHGNALETVEVAIPALDISTWTPSDLTEALTNPSTNSTLMSYLVKANTELQEALDKGETREAVYMVTPVGLIPPKGDYDLLPKPSKNLIKKTKKGL